VLKPEMDQAKPMVVNVKEVRNMLIQAGESVSNNE